MADSGKPNGDKPLVAPYPERLLKWHKSLPQHYQFGLLAIWAVLAVTLGLAPTVYPAIFSALGKVLVSAGFAFCCVVSAD